MSDIVCQHCCHPPTFKHRLEQQQPYLGLWQALIGKVQNVSPDVPIYKRDLDRWMIELWNEKPEAREAFALATTRYGREGMNGD